MRQAETITDLTSFDANAKYSSRIFLRQSGKDFIFFNIIDKMTSGKELDFAATGLYNRHSLILKSRQAFSDAFSRIYDLSTPRISAALSAVKAIIDESHLWPRHGPGAM